VLWISPVDWTSLWMPRDKNLDMFDQKWDFTIFGHQNPGSGSTTLELVSDADKKQMHLACYTVDMEGLRIVLEMCCLSM
jgi:hypothetical protein